MIKSIYDFSFRRLDGGKLKLSDYRDMKMLIVNVASECGYTGQYQQLQELYHSFQHKLVVIGCPCNDFGGQEPGSHDQIERFCNANYGVTFPITEKISINQGSMHPLYKWLMHASRDIGVESTVKWNFQKYLIDEHGELSAVLDPSFSPFDDHIMDWLGENVEVV